VGRDVLRQSQRRPARLRRASWLRKQSLLAGALNTITYSRSANTSARGTTNCWFFWRQKQRNFPIFQIINLRQIKRIKLCKRDLAWFFRLKAWPLRLTGWYKDSQERLFW